MSVGWCRYVAATTVLWGSRRMLPQLPHVGGYVWILTGSSVLMSW